MQLDVGNGQINVDMFSQHNKRLEPESGFQNVKVGRKPRRRRTAFTHSQVS